MSGLGLAGGTTWALWEGTLDHSGSDMLAYCLFPETEWKQRGKRDPKKWMPLTECL